MVKQHTPGPWHAETSMTIEQAIVFADDDHGQEWPAPIADCSDCEDRRSNDEAKANARLISAAPEMLAFIRMVHGSFGGGMTMTFSDADQAEIAAILAKVDGR